VSIWRIWIAGQVDASLVAALLIVIAVLGRHRLTPFVRSTLLIVAMIRLALPPFFRSPWSEAAADLPLVDDVRFVVAWGLHDDRTFYAFAVMSAISVALLVRLAWHAASTRRHLLSVSTMAPDWLQSRASVLATANVEVRLSNDIAGPLAAGVRRKLIVLPASIIHLDPDAIDAVLAHELGHHEKNDLVWITAARALVAIAWFNPLAHVAAKSMLSAREDGSDDWALARTSADRFGYAQALLASARSVVHQHRLLAAGAHPMGPRLRRLLDQSSARDRRLGWSALLIVIIIMAAALPGAHAVRNDSAEDNERVVIVIRK